MWSARRPEVLADLDTLLRLIADLEASPEATDLRGQAASLAHRLHGALGVFGFSEPRSLMADAEAALRASDACDVTSIVARVRRTLP